MAYQVDEVHQVIDRFFGKFSVHELRRQVMIQPVLIRIANEFYSEKKNYFNEFFKTSFREYAMNMWT
jgi:hypothetical protein